MSIEKAIIKTSEGREITVLEQTPIPCFRCGICCTCYYPPLTPEDIDNIVSSLGISRAKFMSRYARRVPIKEGYLLKRKKEGCVFLAWDADGKAGCAIHPSRPQACREWAPTLAKPECLEGLAKLKSEGKIMLLEELFPSPEEKKRLHLALEKAPPQS
ncbi:MAG: YkgJ family cysteine cluster protein [Chloroflexota bacterium]|nr:MAG: YkgJ family cysteine cluster protein [Chloroflexota bacterium]